MHIILILIAIILVIALAVWLLNLVLFLVKWIALVSTIFLSVYAIISFLSKDIEKKKQFKTLLVFSFVSLFIFVGSNYFQPKLHNYLTSSNNEETTVESTSSIEQNSETTNQNEEIIETTSIIETEIEETETHNNEEEETLSHEEQVTIYTDLVDIFITDITEIQQPSETVYSDFIKAGEAGDIHSFYDKAKLAVDLADDVRFNIRKVPVSKELPPNVVDLLNDSKKAFQDAYYARERGMKTAMKYADSNKPSDRSKMVEQLNQSDYYILKGSKLITEAIEIINSQ